MRVLDRKLLRDLWRMRGQALAIALVVAAGVATLILGTGTYTSLFETRQAYYERYRFADVFATAKRAPLSVGDEIARIPGVAGVEPRVRGAALLDLPGFDKPANGIVIALPELGEPELNGLYIREGRLPDPIRSEEVVINAAFAKAHGFGAGATFDAVLNGRKKKLTVVGIVLSPEFIYALGPGDLMPDNQRFGIIWMNHRAAAGAFGMQRAFNEVSLRVVPGADVDEVLRLLDNILEVHGGTGGYARKDQVSHAFIDSELNQLRTVSLIIPPIFLAVAAFLINMTLSRLIVLERQQIGLLKAIGYRTSAIAGHYLKLAGIISLIGIGIGFGVGIWLGIEVTKLYGDVFQFPFLVFQYPPAIFILSAGVSVGAALTGGAWALSRVITLPPAVAMSPPVPISYRHTWLSPKVTALRDRLVGMLHLSQPTIMILRHLQRFPLRAAFTVLGVASSGALLVMSFSVDDAIDEMTDVTFFQADRSDATITFNEIRPRTVGLDVARLPGVLKAEMFRELAATVRHGQRSKRVSIRGLEKETDLIRILDRGLKPIPVPDAGIVLSEKLAELLAASVGEEIEVAVSEGRRRSLRLTVSEIAQGFVGLQAFVELGLLNRLAGDGDVVNSGALLVDDNRWPELNAEVKVTPVIASMALLKASMRSFQDTIREHILMITRIYVSLAFIITFGVVYNSTRIQLSEHARELASLRVLGFTKGEVSYILLGQTVFLIAIAIPLSWFIGYGFTWHLLSSFETELYRVPIVIDQTTYVYTTLTIIAAAAVSALIVRQRIDRLDMVAVLKTRE